MIDLYLRRRKRLLKRLILTAILFILAFFFYALFRFMAYRYTQFVFLSNHFAILSVSVLVVSLLYKPVDYLVLLFFRDVLFRTHVIDRGVLLQLGRSMTKVLNRTELANLIVNTFGEALHVRMASILLKDKTKATYRVISAYGLNFSAWRNAEFSPNGLLIELLRVRRAPVER